MPRPDNGPSAGEVTHATLFDADCTRCPRLVAFLRQVRARHPSYHARPVPSFGDLGARLLIVGLAPGMHGANRTGRPFTGDFAGILLYRMLHAHGFGALPESVSADDALVLTDCRITNAVKCLPPENKPTTAEVRNCNPFLAAELAAVPAGGVVLALGRLAHNAVLRALGLRQSAYPFAHAAEHLLPDGLRLLDSYHCSRYNTQTRRLTEAMFDAVVARCRALLETSAA
ncbi:uracil-DNA glycosylase [Thiohalocapsa marina]|uniref:Type-5 uracil-DNA glycosylase n=1 Tax=Thiohalocapsa marina TaxID=424902 RepID=A0A5M8FF89_9GAMM|nr:uracil-DNA glycosylase [Thiohalocapsa marina]KAA6183044.1 uracil-DNA glycosylase [Thiohalocapsa marina]